MLNGKFYTGLPPKMIDRGSGGGRNRLESHLFWPDDTKTETAAESRIKRRNSVQLANAEKPLYEKQNSVIDDIDTRKRFSKEFSQSSIQFYDNLNETNNQSRRSLLRNSVNNRKMDITEKPTNTKLDLPDNVVSEAYTAAKRKQAYTSKIEFYDYVNDREGRNNLRKPKMDMNDKREMELNSKNSPKLQVKRDVRSLSEEKEHPKRNNREMRIMERQMPMEINDINECKELILNNEEKYLRSRRSVEPRMSISPKSSWIKNRNNRYSCEREICRELEPLSYAGKYENSGERLRRRNDETGKYSPGDYEMYEDNSFHRLKRIEPRRYNTREYYEPPDERHYIQRPFEDAELRNRMRNLTLRSTKQPQKQQYLVQEYYDDASYCGRNNEIETPTNRGSSNDYNERADHEVRSPYKSYNNSTKKFFDDKPSVTKITNQFQRERLASPISPTPSDAESSVSASKSQRHLRSSLCFNNGEIIAENDAATSPTSSNTNPTQKRNARSSATQRVSVGLPD